MMDVLVNVTPIDFKETMDKFAEFWCSHGKNVEINYGKRKIYVNYMSNPIRYYFKFDSEIPGWCKGRTYITKNGCFHSNYPISEEKFKEIEPYLAFE